MNENLEKSLSSIPDKSLELAEKTGQFVIEQGGELLEQFFLWHTAMHVFYLFFGIGLILLWRVPNIWGKKVDPENSDFVKLGKLWFDNNISPSYTFAVIIKIASVISSVWVILYHVYYLIQIIIAPKLYII